MSKRTPGLPQRPRGFWPTPKAAVVPLIPYLPPSAVYVEPCAGDGALVSHLSVLWPGGAAAKLSDIEPQAVGIECLDATALEERHLCGATLCITNPPWPKTGKRGDPAMSILMHISSLVQTWAILPWDFAANDYFGHIAPRCSDIVPVGRVSWMGNDKGGMDNSAWFRFDRLNRRTTAVWPR